MDARLRGYGLFWCCFFVMNTVVASNNSTTPTAIPTSMSGNTTSSVTTGTAPAAGTTTLTATTVTATSSSTASPVSTASNTSAPNSTTAANGTAWPPAVTSYTTTPAPTDNPDASGRPTTFIFALLGVVVALILVFLVIACLRHYQKHRACCAWFGAPSTTTADDDDEAEQQRARERKYAAKMKFGQDTRVRGEHLARLVEFHEQQRKASSATPGQPNLSEHSLQEVRRNKPLTPTELGVGASSPVNPIDRIAGDGVTSHPLARGLLADHLWEGQALVAADGAHVTLEVETPFARSLDPGSDVGAPPNTAFNPPRGRNDEPFTVTLTPVDGDHSPSATPGKDGGLLQRVKKTFTGSRGVVQGDDPRLPQYTHAQVYDTLRSRSRASSRVGAARPTPPTKNLLAQVNDQEDAEAMMIDMVGDSSHLVAAWLHDVEEPPVPEATKVRTAKEWTKELPPAPAGDRGEQRFVGDRTAAWVMATNSGPYDLPPPPLPFQRNPNERWHPAAGGQAEAPVIRVTAPMPPSSASSPSQALLTAKALKLPPKRDALGRPVY